MTAKQIYKKYKNFLSGITKEEAINAIRAIKKDAYNEAIRDAGLLGKVELKWGKPGEPVYEHKIDWESLQKLKK